MNRDSSTGFDSDLPREVRGWNWGAFFLNAFWGLGNRSWFGLLMFVPLVNLFVPFIMGVQGNRWAWENRRWETVEQFHRVQRIWGWVGLATWVVVGGSIAFFLVRGSGGLQGSEAFEAGLRVVGASPRIARSLGTPIEVGPPVGTLVDSGPGGWATIRFEVRGPHGGGVVLLDAHKEQGHWLVERMHLHTEDSGGAIDLLEPSTEGNRAP